LEYIDPFVISVDWVKDNEEEATLPGLSHLSPAQLFWVSWGQVWCSNYRDASIKNQIETGSHSPGRYRIQGPLSNSQQFAEDFKCKKGAKMNKENKCKVW
jgi:predicted metalloendopeptidase